MSDDEKTPTRPRRTFFAFTFARCGAFADAAAGSSAGRQRNSSDQTLRKSGTVWSTKSRNEFDTFSCTLDCLRRAPRFLKSTVSRS
jgi:hypothetical protein